MRQHVCFKVGSFCAGIVAPFANERFFSFVKQHVYFQLSNTDGCEITLVASVSLLFAMLVIHVRFKVFCHLKSEIALNT